MLCPGGAYRFLSFEKEGTHWAEFFNQQGIACFVLRYRLPQGNPDTPIGDACQAIRTIRDSASVWGINPYDVGIMGFSAGGHLAATVSTKAPFDARPNFSILVYPVISMLPQKTHRGSMENLLGKHKDDEQWQKAYSAEQNVDHYATPPALLLLSNDDRAVNPVNNAIAYYTAMRKAGNECTMHIYPDGDHGWGYASWFKYHDEMLGDITSWLHRLPSPGRDGVRVACIGNSITRGACIDMSSKYSYPAQLQKLLGNGYYVRNFGHSGAWTLKKGITPYVTVGAWQFAKAFLPDIAVVKLGTNDSDTTYWRQYGKDFEKDMQDIIDTLKTLPSHPRILLCTPITMLRSESPRHSEEVIVNSIIPKILKIAKKNQLQVVDLHSQISDVNLYSSDRLHPNNKGAAEIARIISEAIKEEKK